MKKSASCIVINPGVVLYVINQSTLVLARVHIIHTSIRSYNIVFIIMDGGVRRILLDPKILELVGSGSDLFDKKTVRFDNCTIPTRNSYWILMFLSRILMILSPLYY
jgi:hypothetical protein